MDHETFETKISPFQERYNQILEKQVSPENIDNYAEDALNELIKLTDDILQEHKWGSLTGKAWEDKAFEEEGLQDIGNTLERIGDKAKIATIAERRIAEAVEKDYEILPETHGETKSNNLNLNPDPNPLIQPIPKFEGLPKTKTILFILNQAFGEDISENGPIILEKGKKARGIKDDQRWPRRYYCIDAPNQNKYILSCDKSDNRTFVIDKDDLKNTLSDDGKTLGIEQIKKMSKTQVGKLVDNMPHSKSLKYSPNYSDRILQAISNRPLSDEQSAPKESNYLKK